MRFSEHRSRRPGRGAAVALWSLFYLGFMLLFVALWIRANFGEVSFEELIANLPITHGGGVGNGGLIVTASVYWFVLPALLTAVVYLARRMMRRPMPTRRRHWAYATVFVLAGALTLALTTGIPRYAHAAIANKSFEQYYVPPAVSMSPKHPKNLITIYLESTESSFGDKERFGKNLLANLDTATADWHDYDGLRQYHSGGWTMAGMVGTQCGIPLKHPLIHDSQQSDTLGSSMDHYLPKAQCLGDILAAQGYTSAYLGGAPTTFAGKGHFYLDHGYTSDQGLEDWKADGEPANSISQWGLSDSHLMVHAEQTVDRLRAAGKPFNLTMITLDTHEPPGVFDDCHTDDAMAMSTSVTCSMKAVAGFLQHLKAHRYLDDTVVMVMGDHEKMLLMGDEFSDILATVPDRRIVMRVWSPDPVTFSRDDADQLSVLPTTLELLGFTVPNGRAGLGVSFVGNHPLAGSILALPGDEQDDLLDAPSTPLYRRLWGLG